VKIAQKYREVNVYYQKSMRGCAPTRNAGAKYAKGDVLVFFDADQVMDIDYLRYLLKDICSNDYGAIAGRVIPCIFTGTLVSEYMSREKDVRDGLDFVDFFGGGSFAMKKDIFERLGGFDEELITRQDLDLSVRVIESGKKIKYEPQAFCIHKERASLAALIKREYYFGVGTYIWGTKNINKYIDPLHRGASSISRTILGLLAIIKKIIFGCFHKRIHREIQIVILDTIMHWAKTVGIWHGKSQYNKLFRKQCK
jgi:GT2 family glycosyltransferase